MNFRRALPAARQAGSKSRTVVAMAVIATAAVLTACGSRLGAAAGGPAHGSPVRSGSPAGTAVAGTASAAPATVVPISPGSTTAPPGPHRILAPSGITLTEANNGDTVVLDLGHSVKVVLGGRTGFIWDRPVATGHRPLALRRTEVSGGYPTRLPARATFVAVRASRAFIMSLTDARCLHAKPRCMIAQRVWRVTIIVRR